MRNEPAQTSDADLARRAREGDRVCFEMLVARYGTRLLAFLRTVTASEDDAVDLSQQAFVRAYQRLETYNPKRPFRPWLFTVARRLALDHGRKLRKEITDADPDVEPVDRCDPAYLLEHRETTRLLWDWTGQQLTPPQFTAFRLRVEEEWDVREIAAAMGRSATHVRVLLYRARRKLAEALHAAGIGTPTAGGDSPAHIQEAPALLRAARRGKEYGL